MSGGTVTSWHVAIDGDHAPRDRRLRLRLLVRQRPRALVTRSRIIPGGTAGQGRKCSDAVALGLERRGWCRVPATHHQVLDPHGVLWVRGRGGPLGVVYEVR